MSTSVRNYLVAGAAAATATAIALAPVQAAPADIAVPAHPTSNQPQLTQAMVDLLAAASRMTAAVAPKLPDQTGGAPALGVAPAAAATGEVGVQNAASDWLTAGYEFIQYWVDYGVELADWVLGWIPGGYLIGDQINIFYWDLIRPIANGYFYGWLVPVVNDPLNLNVWWNGFVNTVDAAINAGIDFGISEFNYFFGWILPPLPPLPGLAATQTVAATQALSLFPNLRDLVGDVVLPPADIATDLAVDTINGAYGAVHNATNFVVDGAEDVLDALRLNFISRQIDINYDLISSLSSQGIGLTTDLIQVPDRYLNDVLVNGEGLLEALGTEARYVSNSLTNRGGAALNAVGNYVDDQIDYFTPRLAAADTQEVTSVPPSARTSLLSPAPAAETPAKATVDSVPDTAQDRAKERAANVKSRVQAGVKDAVDSAKNAADDTREAVKTAVKNATPKSKAKDAKPASAKQSADSGDKDKSGNAKNDDKK
ncbi:hypothetical protein ABQF34_07060 [Mycolicibacterium boenickei]